MQCIDAHEDEMVCIGVRWCALVCVGVQENGVLPLRAPHQISGRTSAEKPYPPSRCPVR
jgi:hypothetical protein